MSRVAIVGSCITRDLWRFSGELIAKTAPTPLPPMLYVSRTSLPSLFATPLAGVRPAARPPGGLRPQPHRALVADLAKTALAELVAFAPTHLIFDFIDERFDLLSAGGTTVTDSWELARRWLWALGRHTHQDNMDVIDRETLKAVGQTVLEVVWKER